MSEKKGGASCEFAALINDKLSVSAVGGEEGNDYSSDKEIIITLAPDKNRGPRKVKLTSRYPAALVVFEKKLAKALEVAKINKSKETLAIPEELEELNDY